MASTTQESLYLHSFRNRRVYSKSDYPITYLLRHRNVHRRMLKLPIYIKHFSNAYTFLFWAVVGIFFLGLHVQVYNAVYGPLRFNQKQSVEYVSRYKNDQSFLSRFERSEYIQVELNKDNIQNSTSTYDTIGRFSNPLTRDNHIATYKKIKHPSIYVKLPASSQKYFRVHHPVHFQLYLIQKLQCIVRNLPLNSPYTYRTWTEKSEYIQYINKEYAKNSTQFNKAVLTKCGVLIGYLYRSQHERAFTGRDEHTFTSDDITLSPLSLDLFPDVIKELWLLDVNGSPHEQLLQLERFIKESSYKYDKNLVIVRNDYDESFVVILEMNENEELDLNDISSPFIVCPVTDIREITNADGIGYDENFPWIPWPVTATDDHVYAKWLRIRVMTIRHVYNRRHVPLDPFARQRRSRVNITTTHNRHLSALIREENNHRFQIEQQSTADNMNNQSMTSISSATARFIARFRLRHERNQKFVNMDMQNEQNQCAICLKYLEINEVYARWRCPGAYLFHYKCMRESLRARNTCPYCRHEYEGAPTRS
ncbi:unnamed protein product [Adineta steineri]|uniref:RING-type domain-containing protein n=1 Tax=Adineta steineri TaxID=433720 RepID=A0A813VVD2_9BILA|nr:unnamed protein product [Adineta steineri]